MQKYLLFRSNPKTTTLKLYKYLALLLILMTANVVSLAQAPKTVPYSFDFTNATTFTNEWSTINANNDAKIWAYDGDNGGSAKLPYSTYYTADDWMFSPAIALASNKNYLIKFKYRTGSSTSYDEKFRVYLCNGNTTTSTMKLLADYNPATRTTSYLQEQLSVAGSEISSGNYYIAFYCYSDKNLSAVYIDDFEISEVTTTNTITVTTGANGSIVPNGTINVANTITRKAFSVIPNTGYIIDAVTVNGTALTPNTVLRNNRTGIYQFNNATAAQTFGAAFKAATVYTVPYLYSFNPTTTTNSSTNIWHFEDEYIVINANNDAEKWFRDVSGNYARINYHFENQSNDWLISPPITLANTQSYLVKFKYKVGSTTYPQNFRVYLTNGPNVSDTVNLLAEYNNVSLLPMFKRQLL